MMDWIKNNTTLLIAIYGAILSTIALIWNIYISTQDKPKIQVISKFGFFTYSQKLGENLLFITAINKGKHPVYLSSFGLRSGEEDLISTKVTGMPCELKPGTSHDESFKLEDLKGKEFDFAWYKDATGRVYKSNDIKKKLNNYFKSNKIKKESVK